MKYKPNSINTFPPNGGNFKSADDSIKLNTTGGKEELPKEIKSGKVTFRLDPKTETITYNVSYGDCYVFTIKFGAIWREQRALLSHLILSQFNRGTKLLSGDFELSPNVFPLSKNAKKTFDMADDMKLVSKEITDSFVEFIIGMAPALSKLAEVDPLQTLLRKAEERKGKAKASEIAKYLMSKYELKTFTDTKETFYYVDGVYRNAEALISEEIQLITEKLGMEASRYFVREVFGNIERSTYVERGQFKPDPNLLNVKNGVLNWKTMELAQHSPDYYFLTKLPVRYDPKEKGEKVIKFIGEILPLKDIPILQERVGHLLYSGFISANLNILFGGGENGRSTFLNLLARFLGKEQVSSVELFQLATNRFATSKLYGKKANISADISPTPIKRLGIIKMLTGRDFVPAEKKFKPMFKFVNNAKLWFSANQPPLITEDTIAIWRRITTIEFPYRFSENPKEYNSNPMVKKADPHILEKITKPKELSGFLNWGLVGLKKIVEQGHFTRVKTYEQIKDEYIHRSDSIKAFRMDRLKYEPEAVVGKAEMYQTYVAHCRKLGLTPKSKVVFGRKLGEEIPVISQKVTMKGERVHCWKGASMIKGKQKVSQAQLSKVSPYKMGLGPFKTIKELIAVFKIWTEDKSTVTKSDWKRFCKERKISNPTELLDLLVKRGEIRDLGKKGYKF